MIPIAIVARMRRSRMVVVLASALPATALEPKVSPVVAVAVGISIITVVVAAAFARR
eukprot:CAMPEP_0172374666 /NCGR_PEP_ID=MMETSP1060-20121228/56814_1 /TAXON_ID=37318 /ORGANISM="Pseudo-nitzschia pungens, Strain cf. cingulata" /LENGTH=56 /DNA_ID=CAMNT_0013101435 /DNA_START=253 /DNA_END=420 /DNA_ORIENTATION=-